MEEWNVGRINFRFGGSLFASNTFLPSNTPVLRYSGTPGFIRRAKSHGYRERLQKQWHFVALIGK
jgi:hypothetical protein